MGHFDYPGKFGAVFASIPAPIFAALYCIFFAYAGEQRPSTYLFVLLVQVMTIDASNMCNCYELCSIRFCWVWLSSVL